MGNLSDNYLPVAVGTIADQLAIRKALKNRDGSVVPVIFGQCKVDGNQLWLGNVGFLTNSVAAQAAKLLRYGDSTQAYEAAAWFAIGMGKLHLVEIRANDKLLIDGTDYNSASGYNDGTTTIIPDINSLVRFLLSGGYGMYGYTTDAVSVNMSGNSTDAAGYYIAGAANDSRIFIRVYVTNGITTFMFAYNGIFFETGEAKSYFNATASAYGEGIFVTVGWYATTGLAYRSTDGKVWTISGSVAMTPVPLRAICYGVTRRFVAVGDGELITYSTDGISWNEVRGSQTGNLFGIAYDGSGIYIAVGATAAGTALILRSTNGLDWVDKSYGLASSLKGICYNPDGGYFLAVGSNDKWAKSTDGLIWTDGTIGLSGAWNSIAYGNTQFVIGGDAGKLGRSSNGVLWVDFTGTYFTCGFGTAKVYEVAYNQYAIYTWVSYLKGIAHMFFNWSASPGSDYAVVCNSSGQTPSMKFVVKNLLESSPISTPAILDGNSDLVGDNPAAIVYDILTNKQWGLGIDSGKIDTDSFNYVAGKFVTGRLYGLNFVLNDLTTGKDILDRIREAADVFLFEENDTFYLKLLYDAEATSVLTITDDDTTGVSVSRQTWKQIDNVFEGEYIEPQLNYEKKTLIVRNEAAIFNADGIERKKKIDLTMFISPSVASQRLNEIMQRESVPKISASFNVGRSAYALRPGDLVTWTNTEYAISGIFRVIEVGIGTLDDMSITVSVIQAFEDLWDGNYNTENAAAGEVPIDSTQHASPSFLTDVTASGPVSGSGTPADPLVIGAPALVNPSVDGNFVAFNGVAGAQKDSGKKAADFEVAGAVAAHAPLQTGVHGLAITAAKTLTVSDDTTLNAASIALKTYTLTIPATGTAVIAGGVAGGQTVIGGSAVTDTLNLQGTSGNGTLTSAAINLKVGNNGGTTALMILNNGKIGIGVSPSYLIDILDASALTSQIYVKNSTAGSAARITLCNDGNKTFALQMSGSTLIPVANNAYFTTTGGVVSLIFHTCGDVTTGGATTIKFAAGGYQVLTSIHIAAGTNLVPGLVAIGGTSTGYSLPSTYLDTIGPAATNTVSTTSIFQITRPIGAGVSYTQAATFALGRYKVTAGNYEAFTRLDILLQAAAVYVPPVTGNVLVLTLCDNGNVGYSTALPTATIHIRAGSATAGTAPLKFTSGPVLTAAEAGAIEFLTDDFYATITTGAARKHFVLDDGTNLTATRVPFATTNGRLVDAAGFTYAGGLLTSGSIVSTGGFGCNGSAAQTAYASGGVLAAYATGAFGLDSDAHMSALHAQVVAIRAALVANGIMS